MNNVLGILLACIALACSAGLWWRLENVRNELRRDASGALSLGAIRVAFREMEHGAIVMLEFERLPVSEGGADEDRYLAQARRLIQAELRDTDVIGRRGCGFVVLLPGSRATDASRKLVHIRSALLRLQPSGPYVRAGLSHTDLPNAWASAVEQLRGATFPDHLPPPGAPTCVPMRLAAEVAGPTRTLALGRHVAL